MQPRPSNPVPGLRLLRAARAQGDGQQVQPQARGRSLSHLGSEAQRRQGNGVDLPDRGVHQFLLDGHVGQPFTFSKLFIRIRVGGASATQTMNNGM